MLHTIVPITQALLQKQIILGRNRISHSTGILERNLFIPLFFSCRFLTFERINTIQRDIQIRQSHTDRRVTCILCDIERT